MGAAAYNRGSNAIRIQIDSERRPAEFEIMDRLNSMPRNKDATAPFGEVRIGQGHGGFWIFCPKNGFGYWYPTINEAVRAWAIDVIGYDNGEWIAIPR